MTKKEKQAGAGKYKDYHASVADMTEDDIVLAIDEELNRDDRTPRVDMLTRLVGRFNRLRGERVKLNVLAAAKKKCVKEVHALLDSNR